MTFTLPSPVEGSLQTKWIRYWSTPVTAAMARGLLQVLRGKANGMGRGPKFRMPALEVAA